MLLTVWANGGREQIQVDAVAIRCDKMNGGYVKQYRVKSVSGEWFPFYKKDNPKAKLPKCCWADGELPLDVEEANRIKKERLKAWRERVNCI